MATNNSKAWFYLKPFDVSEQLSLQIVREKAPLSHKEWMKGLRKFD